MCHSSVRFVNCKLCCVYATQYSAFLMRSQIVIKVMKLGVKGALIQVSLLQSYNNMPAQKFSFFRGYLTF